METPMCECAAFHSAHLDGCPVQHEIDRLRKESAELRNFASHLGIFRAQEEHTAMMAEKNKRIAELEALVQEAPEYFSGHEFDGKKLLWIQRAALSGRG